jgi:hypothetical protein
VTTLPQTTTPRRTTGTRRRAACALAAAWLVALGTVTAPHLLAPQAACATQVRLTAPELELKAAYLLSFLRFVRRTATATDQGAETISVAVLGDDELCRALQAAVQGKRLDGRSITVTALKTPERLGTYDMAYIGFPRASVVNQALTAAHGAPVLTVGESDDFVARGGMIGLFLDDRKLRFSINVAAADEAGLHISASLLSLAAEVHGHQR